MIASTFHVWVVSSDGKKGRNSAKVMTTWSPDGYVTRAFPDPKRGGPKVMIDTGAGQKKYPCPTKKKLGTIRLDTQIKYCTIRIQHLRKSNRPNTHQFCR